MTKYFSRRSPKLTTKTLTVAAMLIAVQVVLGKLSVGDAQVLKVGLGFIGTAMIGYFLGPWLGGMVMIVDDIIANTIFSTGAGFFPGFTLGAFISGVIAGLFLHQQRISLPRLFAYELVQITITNMIFNTLWLHIMYGAPFTHLFWVRLPKEVISWPVESLVGFIVLGALVRALRARNISVN